MSIVVPPPLLAAAAAVAQRGLAGPSRPTSAGRTAVVAALSVASLSMAAAAIGRFSRSGTTIEPFHPEQTTTLVTSGPNAVTRNPMYLGLAGLLLAHALWRGSRAALLPVAGFVAFIDRVQIRAEESALAESFGAEYDVYRATTPRWLGRRSFPPTGNVPS